MTKITPSHPAPSHPAPSHPGRKGFRFELAPLLGITGPDFRRVFFRHFTGYHQALLPFVGVRKGAERVSSAFIRRQWSGGRMPEIPQIINADVSGFLALAAGFEKEGCREINLNAACPDPAIRRKGRGAALVDHPEELRRLLDRVIPQLGVPLSLKIRLPAGGWQGLAELLREYPLRRVILHPRKADQGYRGRPDHAAFWSFMDDLELPIAYSGDIFHSDDVRPWGLLSKNGTDRGKLEGVLLGRGAVANPFLAGEIDGTAPADQGKLETFWNFYYDLKQEIGGGRKQGLDRFKGWWAFWSRSLEGGHRFLKDLVRCQDWEEAESLTRVFRQTLKGWRGLPRGYRWEH